MNAHDGQTRLDAALSLLREWRGTKFFADEGEWKRWVGEFGDRVDRLLDACEVGNLSSQDWTAPGPTATYDRRADLSAPQARRG